MVSLFEYRVDYFLASVMEKFSGDCTMDFEERCLPQER